MIIKCLRPPRLQNLMPANQTLLTGARSCSSPQQSLMRQAIGCMQMREVIQIFRHNPSASDVCLLIKTPSAMSRLDGDIAMAIFASYVIGQFTTTERPKDYSSLRELGWFHNRPAAPKLRAARVAAAWRRCTQEFRRRPGDMFSSSASASNGSPRRSQSSALLARIASSKGSGT